MGEKKEGVIRVYPPLSGSLPQGREEKGIEYGNEFRSNICEQHGVRRQIIYKTSHC